MTNYDIVIIGGGPAGMASAISACKNKDSKILLIERDQRLGGILNQCIHNGFGLQYFKEELTGPSYAQRFIELVKEKNIEVLLNTMVIDVSKEKIVTYLSPEKGMKSITAKAIIFSMGCRERTREALTIPGDRVDGIYTAGTAQYLLNIEGYMPGKEVVILGSGDIGLIMARRLTLEGAKVKAVFEIMDHPGGLRRNIVQCLEDYDIPLFLSHTVIKIIGKNRVEAVEVAEVDANKQIIESTKKIYSCDTLLLSVGLLPEIELFSKLNIEMDSCTKGPIINNFMETTLPKIYACGNVAYVHDLVDIVSFEGKIAGEDALKTYGSRDYYTVNSSKNITMVIPQRLVKNEYTYTIRYRVNKDYRKTRLILKNERGEVVYRANLNNLSSAEMHSFVLLENKISGNKLNLELEENLDEK